MVIKRELTRLASFYLKMINHVLTGGVLKNEQTKKYIYIQFCYLQGNHTAGRSQRN